MGRADCHLTVRPMTGLADECGDTGVVACSADRCFFALVDVLGHGPEARPSAIVAEEFLPSCADCDLLHALRGLHDQLRHGRGAVATLCRIDLDTGELEMTGIGNITCRVFAAEHTRLLPGGGVIGYTMSTPRLQKTQLYPGDIVMLYSDGVHESFEPHQCPGLLEGCAREIAERVMASFGKADDDASCLVMRYTA